MRSFIFVSLRGAKNFFNIGDEAILIEKDCFASLRSARNDSLECSNAKSLNLKGQVILEFAFSMIVVLLMIYGLMMAFRWSGQDLAQRRKAHDSLLTSGIVESYGAPGDGPLKQIDPYFYNPIKMNAVWGD